MLDASSIKRRETSSGVAAPCAPRRPERCFAHLAMAWLLLLLATPAFASNLIPIDTSGHDQDIVFEAGLTDGQVGANGELGSRQFFEAEVFADGLPQSITGFVNPITGNTIDFNFAPFEGNNILKFDTAAANSVPKTLTLSAPNKYGQLAIVHSGGSMAIGAAPEIALLTYTINYVGGAMQTGTVNSVDWGAVPAASMPAGTEILISADRTMANATAWPVMSDNNTTARRWNIYVSEIATEQPTVNIQSVTFGPVSLNTPGTPLNSGDDVVVFGLAGSGDALLPGDTDGDGTVEFEDFDPIRANFRKAVSTRAQGDLARNGLVDFDDFHQWKVAFTGAGGSLAGLDLGLASNVPEPSAVGLTLAALCGIAGVRMTRRSGFPA